MAAPGAPDALEAQHVAVAVSDDYSQAAYQGGAFRTQLLERWLQATGMTEKNLETFVAHPTYDQFWKRLNCEPLAPKVRAPGVFYGGWYTIFLPGTINSSLTLQHPAPQRTKAKSP